MLFPIVGDGLFADAEPEGVEAGGTRVLAEPATPEVRPRVRASRRAGDELEGDRRQARIVDAGTIENST